MLICVSNAAVLICVRYADSVFMTCFLGMLRQQWRGESFTIHFQGLGQDAHVQIASQQRHSTFLPDPGGTRSLATVQYPALFRQLRLTSIHPNAKSRKSASRILLAAFKGLWTVASMHSVMQLPRTVPNAMTWSCSRDDLTPASAM